MPRRIPSPPRSARPTGFVIVAARCWRRVSRTPRKPPFNGRWRYTPMTRRWWSIWRRFGQRRGRSPPRWRAGISGAGASWGVGQSSDRHAAAADCPRALATWRRLALLSPASSRAALGLMRGWIAGPDRRGRWHGDLARAADWLYRGALLDPGAANPGGFAQPSCARGQGQRLAGARRASAARRPGASASMPKVTRRLGFGFAARGLGRRLCHVCSAI